MLGNAGGSLTDKFSALGMDGSMVCKFIPVLLGYVNSVGGSDVMNLLKGALAG